MLTWIVALKVFNAGSPSWCVPRKGTPSHATVEKIRRGEDVKTPKQLREELEKKTAPKTRTSMKISLS